MTKISGIFAAAMSVLNSDLSLNVDKTIEHAEKLIDQGCHGTAIFGSTGQSQLISISEKIDLINKLSISKYKGMVNANNVTGSPVGVTIADNIKMNINSSGLLFVKK